MDLDDLLRPRYSQPHVLAVTGLTPGILQSWVNRNTIALSDHNPGRGKVRQYCPLDIVKLAVMRRLFELRIDLALSLEVASAGAGSLIGGGGLDWDDYIFLRPDDATPAATRPRIVTPPGVSRLSLYGLTRCDPADMMVQHLVEPDRFLHPRRPTDADGSGGVDPARREHLARQGIHAEPVIIFPIGEIVNGALAQLRALDAQP